MTMTNYGNNATSFNNDLAVSAPMKRVPITYDRADGTSFDLPNATIGWGRISLWIAAGSQFLGEATFSWDAFGVTTLHSAIITEGSAIVPVFLVADVAGSFCFTDGGTKVTCKNRTGSTLWVMGELIYY